MCDTLLLRRWSTSSFLSDDVPTMTEFRFAELKGLGVGTVRVDVSEVEAEALGARLGTLLPLKCRDPREPFRSGGGGEVDGGREASSLDEFVVYADCIGGATPSDAECLR